MRLSAATRKRLAKLEAALPPVIRLGLRIVIPGKDERPGAAGSEPPVRMTEAEAREHGRAWIPDIDERWTGPTGGGPGPW